MSMLRLGHYGCQSTTNEMAVMVMGHCQGKVIPLIPIFFGENDKFFKGHIKRFKEGGTSKVSPSKLKVHLRSKRLKYTSEGAHFY